MGITRTGVRIVIDYVVVVQNVCRAFIKGGKYTADIKRIGCAVDRVNGVTGIILRLSQRYCMEFRAGYIRKVMKVE